MRNDSCLKKLLVPKANKNFGSRPLRGYEQATYFVYSFGFLIARSLAVSLIASRVHTASREPVQALYFVPSAAYCVEVNRYIDSLPVGELPKCFKSLLLQSDKNCSIGRYT